VTSLREKTAKDIEELNRKIAEGTFAAVNDPRDPRKAPTAQAPAPHLNFAPIQNAVDSLQRSAERYEKAYGNVVSGAATAAALGRVNALLRQSDQVMLIPDGLPKRPWYQHALYARALHWLRREGDARRARAIEQKVGAGGGRSLLAAALAREGG
jgi:N-acetylated-alpha-linked acidic dipeptidase